MNSELVIKEAQIQRLSMQVSTMINVRGLVVILVLYPIGKERLVLMGVWGRVQGVRPTEEPLRGSESELLITAVDPDFKHIL